MLLLKDNRFAVKTMFLRKKVDYLGNSNIDNYLTFIINVRFFNPC